MKKCLVVPLVGLAISFAVPTYAQEKDVADPLTTQKILAMGKASEEAHNNRELFEHEQETGEAISQTQPLPKPSLG